MKWEHVCFFSYVRTGTATGRDGADDLEVLIVQIPNQYMFFILMPSYSPAHLRLAFERTNKK